MTSPRRILLFTGLLLAMLAGSAQAAPPYPAGGGAAGSLDATVAAMRGRGRVLSAEVDQRDGRPVHVIRLLTPEGRVKRLFIDPNRYSSGPQDAPAAGRR
jgi:hypothetical protein